MASTFPQWNISSNQRFAIAAAFIIAFSIIHRILVVHRIVAAIEPEQCILVTGEFGRPAQYAESAEAGVHRSAKALLPSSEANVTVVRLESTDLPGEASFQQRFLNTIATRRIVAIVSADTSTTARRTLALGTTFKIPVLLVVATTDNLVVPHSPFVFRLVSNDTRQARTIALWARGFERILVVSDATDYGHFLAETIGSELRAKEVGYLHIDIPPSQDSYSLVQGYNTVQPTAAILAGYATNLPVFLEALSRLPTPPSVLLSDGCYTPELPNICSPYPAPIALCFPVDPFVRTRGLPVGFGAVAADAALAIRRALIDARTNNTPRQDLSDTLRAVFSTDTIGLGALSRQYEFIKANHQYSNENLIGEFVIVPIPNQKHSTSRPAPAPVLTTQDS